MKSNFDLFIFFSPHTKCSSSVAPYKLLYGKKYLFEELGSYKFQISPDSFFQINTHAAEILYNKALELADTSNKSTLLDLCSGIGKYEELVSNNYLILIWSFLIMVFKL